MGISLCKTFISDTFEYRWQSSRNVTTIFGMFGVKVLKDKNNVHFSEYVKKIRIIKIADRTQFGVFNFYYV